MSLHDDLIEIRQICEFALGTISHGTEERVRRFTRIGFALKQARVRIAEKVWSEGERGGSSSPREAEDRLEARRVHAQAVKDDEELPAGIRGSLHLMRNVKSGIVRNTQVIDDVPIPDIPGCRSCARVGREKGQRIGGHFAPAMPSKDESVEGVTVKGNAAAAREKLCRWCFDHFSATGDLPPVKACDMYHRVSAAAAGRWLAGQKRGAA